MNSKLVSKQIYNFYKNLITWLIDSLWPLSYYRLVNVSEMNTMAVLQVKGHALLLG